MVKFLSAVVNVDQPEFKAIWFDPYSSTVAAGLRFSLTAATQIVASFANTSLGITRYDILICKPDSPARVALTVDLVRKHVIDRELRRLRVQWKPRRKPRPLFPL